MYNQLSDKKDNNVAIVGAGYAGMCTAIRLMRHARGKMNIYMFEKGGMESVGGIAYGKETADEGHHLNLQAGRISILREDPKHFIRWAKAHGEEMNESSPVSRLLFGRYCEDTLMEEASKSDLVNLRMLKASTIGFIEKDHQVTLAFKEPPKLKLGKGKTEEIAIPETFDHLVLATGHLEVKKPEALKKYTKNEKGLIVDQYIPSAFGLMDDAVRHINRDDVILIMGSGLAALDPVISITERCERMGMPVPKFILCSRKSNLHPTYAPDHQHRAYTVSRPEILNQKHIKLEELETALPAIWEKATLEIMRSDASAISANPKLIDERIMKAMEPYVAELGTKMTADYVKLAFAKWGSLITASRIGVVPKIGDVITKLEREGRLSFIPGELTNYQNGEATITFTDTGAEKTLKPLLLVNSIGRNFNYADTTNELWKNKDTLDFMPQQKTGMGLELTEDSKLVRRDGTAYERVSVVGVSTIGDEIERNGRLGAFSQSQGPIKSRATKVAHQINLAISDPIPEVQEYFQFCKKGRGGLDKFLATLPEAQRRPLSPEGKAALDELTKMYDRRIGNMTDHIYAEVAHNYRMTPAKVLEHLEHSAEDIAEHVPQLVNKHGAQDNELPLLKKAAHILLEKHIADAMSRCCDVTKDPSSIMQSVVGLQ